jgi:hypothetical protein
MKRTIAKVLALSFLAILLFSCARDNGLYPPFYDDPEVLEVIYEGEDLRIVEVAPLTEEQMALMPILHVSYSKPEEWQIYEREDFAAIGIISNFREQRIDFTFNGERTFLYYTLFDFTVDRVHYIKEIDRQIDPGETITVFSAHSSYMDLGFRISDLRAGDEYLMFANITTHPEGHPYDMTKISEFAISSPRSSLIRKNGDYYETRLQAFREYDSKAISKRDAFGITSTNFREAAYVLGIETVLAPIFGRENNWFTGSAREAVLNGEVFGRLFLEYIAEHPEVYLNIYFTPERIEAQGDKLAELLPSDPVRLLRAIEHLPENIMQPLFEQAIATYTLPNILGYYEEQIIDGETVSVFIPNYNYAEELALEAWRWEQDGFSCFSLPDDVFIFRAEEFENTIQLRICHFRECDGCYECTDE